MNWLRLVVPLLSFGLLVAACGLSESSSDGSLFTRLPSDSTGITFANALVERPGRNVLVYDYLYNGGGVAAGDLNGNGRPDLYFTANHRANRLYLNEGEFQFRDVTEAAGVADREGWTTGVTMADVNGDGRLDLYVCRSGWMEDEARRNKLYINQGTDEDGVPQFEEQAAAYGLDDPAYTTHATFFDYDRDGDLDVYLVNHPVDRFVGRFELDTARDTKDPMAGDKLYRNDGGTFVEVSDEVGINSSALGYGLSAIVSDVNRDGWPDLYVANDYIQDDFLYLNQGDGTFEEATRSALDHTSYSSMGADIADYTNDGRPDIYTLDMLAEDNRRQKILQGPRDFRFYRDMQARGYYYQYMRNMLHRNNGDPGSSPGQAPTFSEIGQLAGVSNTDWSWAALFADFDLDGYKDLYVTNGFRRDYTDLDFLNEDLFGNLDFIKYIETGSEDYVDLYALTQRMPATPIPNYAFRNNGDLTFEKASEAWGVGDEGFSNGAAYVDLDGDGALDLVVNNIDEEAHIYRNEARRQTDHHYLRVELEGEEGNRFGIGTQVTLTTEDGTTLYQEQIPARGFQSSVEPVLHFGLGSADTVDLEVVWPDRRREHRSDVAADQTITLRQDEAQSADPPAASNPDSYLAEVADASGLTFAHRENAFIDFREEPLLPHMLSRIGPALARGDVTENGRDDVFVGGARGQASALFLQQEDGTFEQATVDVFAVHHGYEDVDAAFVDVDGDGDRDLYVVSGGASEGAGPSYQDRVYLNEGSGEFTYGADVVPPIESSGSVVVPHDYNRDGHVDLFVGGRVQPGAYPLPPRSYLLENTGGRFEDVTEEVAPQLAEPGMVTDALWHDLDDDGTIELILAGEWMPIRVFEPSDEGMFAEVTDAMGFGDTEGWWYALAAADLDGDGRDELIAGNRGLNGQVQARPEAPATLYADDFDRDGSVDPIMAHHLGGDEYPVYWHDELVEAIPSFEHRFDSYADYAEATIDDILTPEEHESATRLQASTFETSLFHDVGNGTFERVALPVEAQQAPIHGLIVYDVDRDGRLDLVMAGNDFTVRPQWGRADAEKGTVLLNADDLAFEPLDARERGFYAPGDVRTLMLLDEEGAPRIVVGTNNDELSVFSIQPPPE